MTILDLVGGKVFQTLQAVNALGAAKLVFNVFLTVNQATKYMKTLSELELKI